MFIFLKLRWKKEKWKNEKTIKYLCIFITCLIFGKCNVFFWKNVCECECSDRLRKLRITLWYLIFYIVQFIRNLSVSYHQICLFTVFFLYFNILFYVRSWHEWDSNSLPVMPLWCLKWFLTYQNMIDEGHYSDQT